MDDNNVNIYSCLFVCTVLGTPSSNFHSQIKTKLGSDWLELEKSADFDPERCYDV